MLVSTPAIDDGSLVVATHSNGTYVVSKGEPFLCASNHLSYYAPFPSHALHKLHPSFHTQPHTHMRITHMHTHTHTCTHMHICTFTPIHTLYTPTCTSAHVPHTYTQTHTPAEGKYTLVIDSSVQIGQLVVAQKHDVILFRTCE